jgi:hypothetical protein
MTCSDYVSAASYSVGELRNVLFGDEDDVLDPLIALSLLVRLRPNGLQEDLSILVTSPDRDVRLRHHAALALANSFGAEGLPLFLDLLDDEEFVARSAVRALGLVGDTNAIDAVTEAIRMDSPLAEEARRAVSLMAYRTGEGGAILTELEEEIPSVAEVRGDGRLAMNPIDDEVRSEVAESLDRDFFWDTLTHVRPSDPAFEVQCFDNRYVLFASSALFEGLEAVRDRPAVLGLVASFSDAEVPHWYRRYLLVSRPADGNLEDGGLLLRLLSAAGRSHAVGTIRPHDGGSRFTLQAVERAGAHPFVLEGNMGERSIQVDRSAVSARPLRVVLTTPDQ